MAFPRPASLSLSPEEAGAAASRFSDGVGLESGGSSVLSECVPEALEFSIGSSAWPSRSMSVETLASPRAASAAGALMVTSRGKTG